MPSKKRLRPSSASNPGDDTSSRDKHRGKVSPTSGFLFLPAELQRIILELACFSPSSTSAPQSSQPDQLLVHRDTATMFSLTLVCRQLHNQVSPHLWRTITITRPSSLFRLYQALRVSPERAEHVDSLHIGPQDILPANWWPLRLARRGIVSSLSQARLPSDCCEGQVWPLEGSTRGCQQIAVRNALHVAQESFGVNLVVEKMAPTEKVEAVLMVQATLDLYLDKIKSIEEKNGAVVEQQRCEGQCHHYPPLVIAASTASAPSAPVADEAFVLYRSELLRHLARPGATTDRLDHPLLLSRAGFRISVTTPSDKLRRRNGFGGAQYRLLKKYADVASREEHLWPEAKLLRKENKSASSSVGKALNIAVLSTGTLGAVLRLTRGVLGITTDVKTLSLTGFLPHALDGHQVGPEVRRLSLGPRPPRWGAGFPLAHVRNVEELRICGVPLTPTDVKKLLEDNSKLKKLEWTYEDKLPRHICALDVILDLASQHTPAIDSHAVSSGNAQNESHCAKGPNTAFPTHQILARLHPHTIAEALEHVSPEVCSAWTEGRSLGGVCRPLVLEVHPHAISSGSRPSQDNTSPIEIALFREVEAWRQKGAAS